MEHLAMQRLPSDLLEVDWELLGAHGVQQRSSRPHWYPAQGRREVAGVLIGCLSPAGGSVLDPFCGSGTIMTESLRLGRHPVGGDVNLVASLVTSARLTVVDGRQWRPYVGNLRQLVTDNIVSAAFRSGPTDTGIAYEKENRRWYHAATLTELSVIWRAIGEIPGPLQHIALAAFSSILRQSSSRRGPANRIADNIRPDSLVYRNAVEAFFRQLDVYQEEKLGPQIPISASRPEVQEGIWANPSESILPSFESCSIDLVATRIPEPGVVDHVRSQRLSYLWFGWDISQCESAEIGARYKYRRDQARQEYLQGIESVFTELVRVLKPGGWLAAILGPAIHKHDVTAEIVSVLRELNFADVFKLGGRMPSAQGAVGQHHRREEILVAYKEH